MIAFGVSAGGWLVAAACAPWWWLRLACGALAFIAGSAALLAWAYEREQGRRSRRERQRDEAIVASWLNHTFSPN
jgi:membrane protein implicated in regulation of membrane protease activity